MGEIRVTGRFEGGNPQGKDDISRISDNVFLVKPFCEDDQVNYKFRMDIVIDNQGEQNRIVDLVIDWVDTTHSQYRDLYYLKGPGNEWMPVSGASDGAITHLKLSVLPGKTSISLNPGYSYSRYIEFVNNLTYGSNFSKKLLYTTDLGREVYVLCADSESKFVKRILITARTHPYESAGSYNIEGLVEGIKRMQYHGHLKGFQIWIVPMVCPDGVADGLCRLNRASSPDLSREIDISDNLCKVYMKLIDEVKPTLFLEFHNWMLKDHDGIFYLSAFNMIATILRMGMQTSPFIKKPWIKGLDHFFLKRKPLGLKKYAEDTHGTKCATIEFPWFVRSPEDMKSLGLQTLLSILPIA
jgi:hypothetical protein